MGGLLPLLQGGEAYFGNRSELKAIISAIAYRPSVWLTSSQRVVEYDLFTFFIQLMVVYFSQQTLASYVWAHRSSQQLVLIS